MAALEQSIRIEAPPERVWAALVDVERWPEWTASVKKLERLDDRPLALGSRARIWLKGALDATTWVVTRFDEGRSFTWETRFFRDRLVGVPWEQVLLSGFTSVGDHELTPDGDGTNVVLRVSHRGALSGVIGLLLRRISRDNLRLEAAGLKRASEAQ